MFLRRTLSRSGTPHFSWRRDGATTTDASTVSEIRNPNRQAQRQRTLKALAGRTRTLSLAPPSDTTGHSSAVSAADLRPAQLDEGLSSLERLAAEEDSPAPDTSACGDVEEAISCLAAASVACESTSSSSNSAFTGAANRNELIASSCCSCQCHDSPSHKVAVRQADTEQQMRKLEVELEAAVRKSDLLHHTLVARDQSLRYVAGSRSPFHFSWRRRCFPVFCMLRPKSRGIQDPHVKLFWNSLSSLFTAVLFLWL